MSCKARRRVALYLRVSTSEQTTENQRRELQAIADKAGWMCRRCRGWWGLRGEGGKGPIFFRGEHS
ncbi:recombinase family protein [Xanthobacter autotrophicus]|uniref:recombinase family protein n=1 Tax=Xanthobacter autotrophicus TaxID=280 RepID=UPI0024AA8415|nr:recombinase family protein [Xanthobacter autotrophicus]MDI4666535.1 recombinase family protein [Xanthobacter autotrophicus]